MAGFKLELEGVDESFAKLDSKELIVAIQKELSIFGEATVADAKQLAPVDEGRLRNSIQYQQVSPLAIEIMVNVDYAAYVEFGTRKFASAYVSTLPADWQAFAQTFKGTGTGGSFEDFVLKLVKWVQHKGIGQTFNVATHKRDKIGGQSHGTTDYATAYQIARWIVIMGVRPHPYLYPAFQKNKVIFLNKLKELLRARY